MYIKLIIVQRANYYFTYSWLLYIDYFHYRIIYYIATRIASLVLPNLSRQSCFSLRYSKPQHCWRKPASPRLGIDAARYKVAYKVYIMIANYIFIRFKQTIYTYNYIIIYYKATRIASLVLPNLYIARVAPRLV